MLQRNNTVLILGYRSETNIALRKSTRQSSIVAGALSSKAVDGNIDQDYYAGSCTHTNDVHEPWWEVDLFGFFSIERVVIFNRVDCCRE